MMTLWQALAVLLIVPCFGAMAEGQSGTCSCGLNPPGPPPSRTLEPYDHIPSDVRPYSQYAHPYYEHYTKSTEYHGAARDVPTVSPSEQSEVLIGFLGPVEQHKDQALGQAM